MYERLLLTIKNLQLNLTRNEWEMNGKITIPDHHGKRKEREKLPYFLLNSLLHPASFSEN